MWRAMLCGLAVAAVACAGTGRKSAEATRPTPEDDVVSVGYGTQSRRSRATSPDWRSSRRGATSRYGFAASRPCARAVGTTRRSS